MKWGIEAFEYLVSEEFIEISVVCLAIICVYASDGFAAIVIEFQEWIVGVGMGSWHCSDSNGETISIGYGARAIRRIVIGSVIFAYFDIQFIGCDGVCPYVDSHRYGGGQ